MVAKRPRTESTRPRQPLILRAARALLRWQSAGAPSPLRSAVRRYLSWNRRLLLDPELRYRGAILFLKQLPRVRDPKILDVGSGAAGLAYFLKSPVVGLDVDFASQDFSR